MIPLTWQLAATVPAPPVETFRREQSGLSGCLGLVWRRSAGDPPARGTPLLAAWSLRGGRGVMRIDGALRSFPLASVRRLPGRGAQGQGGAQLWNLTWQVGRYSAELRFPSTGIGPQRWGGEGVLRLSSLATGDSFALPVRVEGGC